jgi:hypothetical protein
MTIIAAISASRQGTAPLHLAAQIARSTGDKIIATAIVERPWRPDGDPVDDEYFQYVASQASRSLERVVSQLPADLDISVVVHQSTSIPSLGKPATSCCWDQARPDRRLKYSSARPPRKSCGTPLSP